VSWDDALGNIGSKVRELIDNHGRDSIALYVGTAAGFGVLHPVFAQGFMAGVGSASMFSSATQDCANKFAVAHQLYGFPFTQPFPDLDNLGCLIIVGANPAISKWSFLQVSNPIRRLKEIEARGAKIFVVDPRRTETAKVAGEHVFIRPNTDVFFYLSFLHELLATTKVDRARIDRYMTGFEELSRVAEAWPPERTAEVTRIPAETLRGMVRAYTEADGAALYCSTGVNMGTNGSLAFWLQECINAISGNLDRRGGTLVSTGVIDFAAFGKKTGTLLHQNESRIGGFKSVNDAMPGGILADEILGSLEGRCGLVHRRTGGIRQRLHLTVEIGGKGLHGGKRRIQLGRDIVEPAIGIVAQTRYVGQCGDKRGLGRDQGLLRLLQRVNGRLGECYRACIQLHHELIGATGCLVEIL